MAAERLLELRVRSPQDRLITRQRGRELCRELGIEEPEAARFGVTLGEAMRSAGDAETEVTFAIEPDLPALLAEVRPGGGPVDLSRLAGNATLASDEAGEKVLIRVGLPQPDGIPVAESLAAMVRDPGRHDALDECEKQHQELIEVISILLRRERELEQMGVELEETNRGVLALYSELDEAARQWHTTFDSISDGVALLDPSGRIVRVNDSMCQLLTRDAESIVGTLPAEILPEVLGVPDAPGLVPILARASGRQVAELQNGERWFSLTLDAIGAHGRKDAIAGGVLIVSDVTERRRMEEQRRLAEKRESEAIQLRHHARRMGELERMKSDFLNLASHELRGPLAVLRGYVSMLEDGSLGDLTDNMRSVVPVMAAKMREMNLLINQMLETARIEDSRLVLDRAPLDLRDVLADAIESMRPIAGEHHPLLRHVTAEPVTVDGDRNRLTTIVTNLIDNAVKYSPDGGTVGCRLAVVDGRAALSVSDSGIGIRPEDMSRLFTRFGRLVNAENSHIPGTGLGLYLARELARMHGGEIEVESQLGEGSTFRLLLPRLEEGE